MNAIHMRARLLGSLRQLSEHDQADILRRALAVNDEHVARMEHVVTRSGALTTLATLIKASMRSEAVHLEAADLSKLIDILNGAKTAPQERTAP